MNPNQPIDRQDVADEPKTYCDFCQDEITEDEEPRYAGPIDDSVLLCESCACHYLD